MLLKNNYFFSSFFWSFLSKVLNAIFGFVSTPLLLGYFGKADYGLLSIATACNGYMHVMDLGVNTGAIKYFAQWNAEGKRDLIQKVSNTNTTFYLIISCINVLGLLALAWFGESFFSVTHEQFLKLRTCFFILALFASFNWLTSAYTQLLTAYKKIAFTMKVNCVMVLLRIFLILSVFVFKLNLSEYFFFLTATLALCILPNIIKCKKDKLLDTIKPAMHWKEFGTVFSFSMSIFAISLFQMTATQSRPIVLSIFAEHGAEAVADYRIIEVFPLFVMMLCGSFTAIFLPKSSELMAKKNRNEMQNFVNVWTTKTTILVCVLSFPIIVASSELLGAYVGPEHSYLGKWLQVWCFFLIFQMHSTPAYSFILAKGKTKVLVTTIGVATILSIIVNISLSKIVPVGSAVVSYVVYMICQVSVDYIYMYKYCINLDRLPIIKSFLAPFLIGAITCVASYIIPIEKIEIFPIGRFNYLLVCAIKTGLWLLLYAPLLFIFRILNVSEIRKMFAR